jgi:uncharacterized metal-binding protein
MKVPHCALCVDRKCTKKEWFHEELPEFCPMKYKKDVINLAMEKYDDPEALKLFKASNINEQRAYMNIRGRLIAVRPRVLEIIKFCEMMNWKKIGIAFCAGLGNEAKRVVEIFESSGLDVYSVCCKCGSVDKGEYGIAGEDKISALVGKPDSYEGVCNPIVQAELLNLEKVDLKVIIGLCIGHDIQFTSFAEGPVTTLIVKDRVTGHNPFASLFSNYHHPRMWNEE